MDLGKTILELRKQKNVTQEDMAAELGVTAAAVSKWEHSSTLPDILMLGALADYFEVTTDELLGRYHNSRHAVILAANHQLGEKMEEIVKKNGFEPRGIFTNETQALSAAQKDPRIKFLIVGVYQNGYIGESLLQTIVSCHTTDDKILAGLQWAFENCLDEKSNIKILT